MYEPQIDDYVKWTTALGMVHEGWVYFKCHPTPHERYMIEQIENKIYQAQENQALKLLSGMN